MPQADSPLYDSLEALHDTIHNIAGGGGPIRPGFQGGHMSYVPYSAFDPIFFLHHCMVDRIFAIWQVLHPETWIRPAPAVEFSYTTRRGQIQNASTPLTPFFASGDGTFWTSDGVRDHTILGYTYPELVQGPASGDRMGVRVRRAINRLYGTNSLATLFISELQSQGFEGSRKMTTTSLEPDKLFRSSLGGKIFDGDHYREWMANIRVGKQALDGPFSIHFFLGQPPDDTDSWTSSPNHVGTMGVFAADRLHSHRARGTQETRRDSAGVPVSGTVPLTAALARKVGEGELGSLEPVDVERFLRDKLEKRVLGPDGTVLAAESVSGLRIAIVSSLVRAPYDEDELPEWGPTRVHFEVC